MQQAMNDVSWVKEFVWSEETGVEDVLFTPLQFDTGQPLEKPVSGQPVNTSQETEIKTEDFTALSEPFAQSEELFESIFYI